MNGQGFEMESRETKRIETKHRRIVTPIPVPESFEIIKEMQKYEPISNAGQPLIVWDHTEDGYKVCDPYGNKFIDFSSGVMITNAGHGNPEIIDAIKNHTTNEFREKYRNVDVLLIDDIQFIIKKESTQTEFFNTFNELYNNKKQIILSSDQPPKELQSLNERIRSRFECGIPIDIHEPDYETRMAILKTKAEMDHLNDIPEEVFQYIAENVTNNIRELEGALHKIGIFSKLMKEEVTLETAKESLKDLINKEKNETITGETILKTVSEHMNISPDDIRSKKRSQDIATARQVVMYLCRKLTVMSLQSAGNIVGGRDHTTVINGINRVEAKRKEDPAFNNTIETIIKKLDTNA